MYDLPFYFMHLLQVMSSNSGDTHHLDYKTILAIAWIMEIQRGLRYNILIRWWIRWFFHSDVRIIEAMLRCYKVMSIYSTDQGTPYLA
jgi:hypothetical protein